MCSNCRGISLLSVPGKEFGLIIVERMCADTERKLRENEGDFKTGRGSVDKIFCLQMLIEKWLALQPPALAIFVDFESSFRQHSSPFYVEYSRRL